MGGRGSDSVLHRHNDQPPHERHVTPLHPETERQAWQTIREFSHEHPVVANHVHELLSESQYELLHGPLTAGTKRGAYAATYMTGHGESGIFINNALDRTGHGYRSYRYDREQGFHPASSNKRDIIYHEMGHAATNSWGYQVNGTVKPTKTVARQIINRATKLMHAHGVSTQRKREMIRRISGYAAKNPAETVAEALVDVRANGRNAQPISRAINNVINHPERYTRHRKRH